MYIFDYNPFCKVYIYYLKYTVFGFCHIHVHMPMCSKCVFQIQSHTRPYAPTPRGYTIHGVVDSCEFRTNTRFFVIIQSHMPISSDRECAPPVFSDRGKYIQHSTYTINCWIHMNLHDTRPCIPDSVTYTFKCPGAPSVYPGFSHIHVQMPGGSECVFGFSHIHVQTSSTLWICFFRFAFKCSLSHTVNVKFGHTHSYFWMCISD